MNIFAKAGFGIAAAAVCVLQVSAAAIADSSPQASSASGIQVVRSTTIAPYSGPTAEDSQDFDPDKLPGDGGGGYSTIHWNDIRERVVYYRPAAQEHVQTKHALSNKTVQLSTQYPQQDFKDGTTGWIYRLSLDERYNGEVIDRKVVHTKVDFRKYGSQTFGVFTSYCEGIQGKCPSWVNLAFS